MFAILILLFNNYNYSSDAFLLSSTLRLCRSLLHYTTPILNCSLLCVTFAVHNFSSLCLCKLFCTFQYYSLALPC
nr:MAG TPA: hypothetical protein [Caudoviricetes sp.]